MNAERYEQLRGTPLTKAQVARVVEVCGEVAALGRALRCDWKRLLYIIRILLEPSK